MRKRRSVLSAKVPTVSIGSNDIAFVYRNQIEIRIRKLNANPPISTIASLTVEGTLARSDREPIESASPKTKSVNDSSRVFGIRLLL